VVVRDKRVQPKKHKLRKMQTHLSQPKLLRRNLKRKNLKLPKTREKIERTSSTLRLKSLRLSSQLEIPRQQNEQPKKRLT